VSKTSIMLLMLVPSLLRRVVCRVTRCRDSFPRNRKAALRRLTAHENEPVRYRIMMIDATTVAMRGAVTAFIAFQSTGSGSWRQRGPGSRCHFLWTSVWMNGEQPHGTCAQVGKSVDNPVSRKIPLDLRKCAWQGSLTTAMTTRVSPLNELGKLGTVGATR